MVNNFTNNNKMNNYPSPQIIKHNIWWVEIQVLFWHGHKIYPVNEQYSIKMDSNTIAGSVNAGS